MSDGGTYSGSLISDGTGQRWPHGRGVYTWPDGRKYNGEFRDGQPHGTGVATWPDGSKYDGEWRDGKRHGAGVRTWWPDGPKYEGEWRDGKRHGMGVATWPDGSKYEGEYRDGQWHVTGVGTWPDGDKYEGEFRDGPAEEMADADDPGEPEPANAGLVVINGDEDAEVFVGDRFVGNPPARLQLAAGEHTIRVTRDGFEPYERVVTVSDGAELTLNASLQPE